MEPQELADILTRWYCNAPDKNATTMIHLFGIVYADEIRRCGVPATELVRLSDLRDTYVTEVAKGLRLARYVTVRRGALSF